MTALGRVLGGVFALSSILLVALPTAVLGSGFMEEMGSEKETEGVCPHCGRSLNDPGRS